MPRKKDPDNVKQLRATERPDRMNPDAVDFESVEQKPDAPSYLDVRAKGYWDRIVPILISKRVLSVADLEALEVMCSLYGKVRQMVEAGVDISSALVTQLRLYQAEFGLTPVSRTKIAQGSDKPKNNPFANNGSKSRSS